MATEKLSENQKVWQKAGENLIRYIPSGTYYARIRVRGKLVVRSLGTDVLTTAKLLKADMEKAERAKAATQEAIKGGG